MHLEKLSPELAAMILQLLYTPKDLHSTICASPFYLAVFRNNKPRILAAVIQRAFSSATHDALLALCASPASTTTAKRPKTPLARLNHLKEEELGTVLLDPTVSIPLCRLWHVVNCFVDGYCQASLAKLHECAQHWNEEPQGASLYAVSDNERYRLQRAFVRFETYRRCFGGPDRRLWIFRDPGWVTDADYVTQDHRMFVGRFLAWELEELHSVYDYLVSIVGDTVDDLENFLFAQLQAPSKEDGEDLGDILEELHFDLIGLSMFQQGAMGARDSRPHQIAHMVELGLPFLQRIGKMSMDDRMATITPFTWKARKPSLDYVLEHVTCSTRDNDQEAAASKDPISRANAGWLWRHSAGRDCDVSQNHGLRSLGYVFWDEERLVEAGLLDLNRGDVGFLQKRTAWDANPSVEEKLQGVNIRWGALCKLEPGRDKSTPEKMEDWLKKIDYESGDSSPSSVLVRAP